MFKAETVCLLHHFVPYDGLDKVSEAHRILHLSIEMFSQLLKQLCLKVELHS
jgi:hypothetical protein